MNKGRYSKKKDSMIWFQAKKLDTNPACNTLIAVRMGKNWAPPRFEWFHAKKYNQLSTLDFD